MATVRRRRLLRSVIVLIMLFVTAALFASPASADEYPLLPIGGEGMLKQDSRVAISRSCFSLSADYQYEVINYKTAIIFDEDKFEDYCKVESPGRDGSKLVEYSVISVGDEELSRKVVGESVISEAEDCIIRVGVKYLPELHESETDTPFILPHSGKITSPYGPRVLKGVSEFHKGIDISAPTGDAVYASMSGKVVRAEYCGSYGNMVEISHGGGYSTIYAHMSRISAKVGEKVVQGEKIGEAGDTGRAYGSHVHFEIRENNKTTDPLKLVWRD